MNLTQPTYQAKWKERPTSQLNDSRFKAFSVKWEISPTPKKTIYVSEVFPQKINNNYLGQPVFKGCMFEASGDTF